MKINKQDLYIFIIMIALIGLTVGYAIINSTLNINGKSNISKNTWNVYFDNIVVKEGSVGAEEIPTISNATEVNFKVMLNMPGDFYEFTVDVVNNGTIDAMIESVVKTPTLTSEQAKYLNYTITYANDEQIITKQLLNKESSVRLKVKVELRKDIAPSDLPEVGDVLYLGFEVNYVQADETAINVIDNGKINIVNVISGDGTNTGDEICIEEECFYVISSNDDSVTMLSKYNLYVGGEYYINLNEYGSEATGKQDFNMIGYKAGQTTRKGITPFSNINYWADSVSKYPAFVFNENSLLYKYVDNYKSYLTNLGVDILDARLIKIEELKSLGCAGSSCDLAPSWVYSTSYWTGSSSSSGIVSAVFSYNYFGNLDYSDSYNFGVRPVIAISKSLI